MSPKKTPRTRRQLDPGLDRDIGSLLRRRRLELGWSQQTLAARLDLTFQQVQKYENGRNQISAARLMQLCEVLGVPVTYFVERTASADPFRKVDFAVARALSEIPDETIKAAFLRLARECARAK